MGHLIHRKNTPAGPRYRLWSTVCDQYSTDEMTRDEVFEALKEDAIREVINRVDAEVDGRLSRCDVRGTSSMIPGDQRDMVSWDTERCNGCGTFHHEYKHRASDGMCGDCGEPRKDKGHQEPCKEKNA